jgi:hypothetical protein
MPLVAAGNAAAVGDAGHRSCGVSGGEARRRPDGRPSRLRRAGRSCRARVAWRGTSRRRRGRPACPTVLAVVGVDGRCRRWPSGRSTWSVRRCIGRASARQQLARRSALRVGGLGDQVGQQDQELVAAMPADGVCRAHRLATSAAAASCSTSSPTAWPQRVVDLLEVVEVDEQQRDLLAAGARLAMACSKRSSSSTRLRQLGQRIELGRGGLHAASPALRLRRRHATAAPRR